MSNKAAQLFRMVPALLVMAAIFFLSAIPGGRVQLPLFPGADKIAHAVVYGLLALTVLFAFSLEWRRRWPLRSLVLTVFFSLLYGISDELHQAFVPGRSPDFFDLAADGCGALLFSGLWFWRRAAERKEPGRAFSSCQSLD